MTGFARGLLKLLNSRRVFIVPNSVSIHIGEWVSSLTASAKRADEVEDTLHSLTPFDLVDICAIFSQERRLSKFCVSG